MDKNFKKEVAECVGLWLADGWNKETNNVEIAFTNSCLDLILLFNKVSRRLYRNYNFRVRIYVYSNNGRKIKLPISNVSYRFYKHSRARKPYFIWRLASVEIMKKWKTLVKKISLNEKMQIDVLRGFFAGEGSIMLTKRNKKILISQAKRVKFIEDFFRRLEVTYDFCYRHRRGYEIYRRTNWDKLAKIRIADLHPEKKKKFWMTYKTYKEYHDNKGFLKSSIIKLLNNPTTSNELSFKFRRTPARIYDVLEELKEEGLIERFRVRSKDYWIKREKNKVIISKLKVSYLKLISHGYNRTYMMVKKADKSFRSVQKRLKELERLGLINRNNNKEWRICDNSKELIVI